jgi:hypothetical protein
LGLVISEYAAANLDTSLEWIDVISESKINDLDYVSDIIIENRRKSRLNRDKIRKYAIDKFSYDKIYNSYISEIKKIFNL